MVNINNYSFVLLSAGTGSRMGKLTKNKPKKSLEGSKRIFVKKDNINFKRKKLKNLSIVVGFKANQIIKEINNIKDIKFNVIKN